MALPKKNSRTININDTEYCWIASGNDDIIFLIVCLKQSPGQKLVALFNYTIIVENNIIEVQITPAIVKQVIEYAIKNGWNPHTKGKELNIGIMNDIINHTI